MQYDKATDLKLFLIEQDKIVFAMGMWTLGDDQRQWNWVQAFKLDNGKIVQTVALNSMNFTPVVCNPTAPWTVY